MRTVLVFILLLLAIGEPAYAAERLVGRASVIDGDTIELPRKAG
jgi:hypothetical protein